MIEYKRMVRTMRRRFLLGALLLVAGIFIWQLLPLPTDQLARSITPEQSKMFYTQQGIAQALSTEIKNLQRRLERHLERLEKLRELQKPSPDSGTNLTWNLAEILPEKTDHETVQNLIRSAEKMLGDNRPGEAIIQLDRARLLLSRQLDNALAANHLLEATQLMKNMEPHIMNEPASSLLTDNYNAAGKMATEYLERGRIADAADALTEFLTEQ